EQEEHYRGLRPPGKRHRLAGSAGGAAHGANSLPAAAPRGPQEGLPHSARAVDAGGPAAPHARLSAPRGRGALPHADRAPGPAPLGKRARAKRERWRPAAISPSSLVGHPHTPRPPAPNPGGEGA